METNKWESRRFLEMEKAAVEWLRDKDPEKIASNCGGVYDPVEGCLRFAYLGEEISVRLPDFRPDFRPDQEDSIWEHLMLLHYLNLGDGTPASAKMMVDASADHYLLIEDAVTVGEVLIGR